MMKKHVTLNIKKSYKTNDDCQKYNLQIYKRIL